MIKYNLTIVQKICLAGIFIPLIAIFQKVFAINYIAVIPFVRISFGGPALIIFASVLLGPWFGLFVGAMSDIVGFFILIPRCLAQFLSFKSQQYTLYWAFAATSFLNGFISSNQRN